MPRKARERSKTGIYHIIVRGINRQEIFHDEDDKQRYLTTLQRITEESEAKVLGYCLMGNHVHLLIQEGKVSISGIMKRVGASYAFWYNWKYERSGHLFQDRFKSEHVEDDAYLLTVIRYIHQNPVKAGMVEKPEEYRWSSCSEYYSKKEYASDLTQPQLVLGLFAENREIARKQFMKYMKENTSDTCLEDKEPMRISDEKIRQEIGAILKGKPISVLQNMEREERDEIVRKIKEIEGSSLRQIARITGLSLNMIFKA